MPFVPFVPLFTALDDQVATLVCKTWSPLCRHRELTPEDYELLGYTRQERLQDESGSWRHRSGIELRKLCKLDEAVPKRNTVDEGSSCKIVAFLSIFGIVSKLWLLFVKCLGMPEDNPVITNHV